MKEKGKEALKIVFILIISIITGMTLLIVSYMLPVDKMEENVLKSVETFKKEETYEKEINNFDSTTLDNFTDAIMLQNATYKGDESIIQKSVNVFRYLNDEDSRISLIEQLDGAKEEVVSYDRYWHGYLVFLKPLLLIFNYNDIRMINSIIQPLLILIIGYLLIKKGKEKYLFPYIISIIMISPNTIAKSLQFSTIFYLFNIAMLIILLFNDKLKNKNNYSYLFLIIGILTSYFDFLTYPLATLGMPLTLYFILNDDKNYIDKMKFIVSKSFMWGIGYVGMWIGKVVYGSILVQRNLFISFFEKFNSRTSFEAFNEEISIISILKSNIIKLLNGPYILLIVIIIVYMLYRLCKKKTKIKKDNFLNVLPYYIVSLIPFAWYIIASNHSYIHSWFTYRLMVITIFALLSSIVYMLDNSKK